MTNLEHLASGVVIHSAPGLVACPVGVALAAYEAARAQLERLGAHPPYALFDPCAGGGYLLTVLGLSLGAQVRALYAADIDARACEFAQKNLLLCTRQGMERRRDELASRVAEFGKDSHKIALGHAERFLSPSQTMHEDPRVLVMRGDALHASSVALPEQVSMVITEIPYGEQSQWQGDHGTANVAKLFTALHPKLAEPSVIAVISRKKESFAGIENVRLQKLTVATRQITVFRGR